MSIPTGIDNEPISSRFPGAVDLRRGAPVPGRKPGLLSLRTGHLALAQPDGDPRRIKMQASSSSRR